MMVVPQSNSDRLETLTEISRAVSSKLDLHVLYDTIYQQVSRVMDATLFSLAIYEPEQQLVSLPYIREAGNLFLDQSIPFGAGLTSLVIQQGEPRMFQTNDEYREFARANGLPAINVGEDEGEAVIFVPLHTGSRVIGVLSVESKRADAYAEQDLETLSIIASQAAIAIENARLFERSREAMRQMAVLAQVAQSITALPTSVPQDNPVTGAVRDLAGTEESGDLYRVLDAILQSMREVMPYAFAALLLPDYTTRTLDIVGSIWRDQVRSSVGEGVTMKIPFGHGISGAVFESGEPLIVPDVRKFEGFVDHELAGVFSEMAVPLKRGTSTIGVLDVGRDGVNAFSDDEVNLLSLFASQAAIAIENSRLFGEQRRRVKELQTIQSIVRQLTPLQDYGDMTVLIDHELKQLIDYDSCCVYLIDHGSPVLIPQDDPVQLGRLSGLTQNDPVQSEPPPIGRGFAGWIARTGRADIVTDQNSDEGIDRRHETFEDEQSQQDDPVQDDPVQMVGAPLSYEGRVQGAITLSKRGTNQFDSNAMRVLEIIAAQLAIAFDRARLYEELRTEAITDSLVNLWNRRYMLERYREERTRATRTRRPLAAIMLDIDKFKQVNDAYGHDAGDIVLQELGSLLRLQVRAEDIVARWGGEEFCILLPESSLAEALFIAQRIRRAIAEHRLPATAGAERVTASLGVAASWSEDTGEELFARADAAMYHVKVAGGNGIAVIDPLAQDDPAVGGTGPSCAAEGSGSQPQTQADCARIIAEPESFGDSKPQSD